MIVFWSILEILLFFVNQILISAKTSGVFGLRPLRYPSALAPYYLIISSWHEEIMG
jgi:hypothetical protein